MLSRSSGAGYSDTVWLWERLRCVFPTDLMMGVPIGIGAALIMGVPICNNGCPDLEEAKASV